MNQQEFYAGSINASECVSNGWNLAKQNYGLYLGISFVAFLMVACIPCVNIFIAGPVTAGIYYCFLRGIRGEPVEFGMMFKGFENFVPAMVVGLITAIPEVLAQIIRLTGQFANIGLNSGRNHYQTSTDVFAGGIMIFAIIAGIILFVVSIVLRISLFFALPLIVEKNMGAVDAMKLSAKAAWSNVGGLIVLFIFEFLIALVGIFALCIGIFFVMPIIYAANCFAYRQVFPDTQQNFQNNVPPPPSSYGNNYGSANQF